MTSQIIDINYLYMFNDRFLEMHAEEIATNEISKINSSFEETDLFISMTTERQFGVMSNILDIFIKYKFKTITLLIDYPSWQETYSASLSKNVLENCKIIPFHFWIWYCVKNLERRNIRPPTWNPDNRKGLFRTGRVDRFTRIEILKALYDANLLDNNRIEWTFPRSIEQKPNVLKYYSRNYGSIPDNFDKFYNHCIENASVEKNPSFMTDIYPQFKDSLPVFCPTNFYVDCYDLASFSILSETWDDEVGDKSYLTMLYQHPFIIVNKPKVLKNLKQLGFKTFDNYLPHEYASIEDDHTRLAQIIENIKIFPKILEERKEEIIADVQHNYNLCIKMAAETDKYLNDISDCITVENLYVSDFVNKLGPDLYKKYKEQEKIIVKQDKNIYFVYRYNIIKAESWPNIQDENDFHQLPNWIKEECMTNYNFPGQLITRVE